MTLSDKLPNLNLTMRDYFFDVFDYGDVVFSTFEKILKRADHVYGYIFKSKTWPKVEGTLLDTGLVKDLKLFDELKKMNFWFVVIMKKDRIEEAIVYDEIFDDIESATLYLRRKLLEY